MGRMSDLDIERQKRESDDSGWGRPDDVSDLMELERQEQHHNQLTLLANATNRVIQRVDQAEPGQADVHCQLDSAQVAFRLTSFEYRVVKRAYDLDCHLGGTRDLVALVDEAYDEVATEEADD